MGGKKGYLLAIFGSDGSGKSTVAKIIEDICREQGFSTSRNHWRPRLLPSLKKVGNTDFDTTRPNNLPTRPWLVSLGIYIYFFLDFFSGYFLRFQPLLRNGEIIIYERYYYDLLFHPKRYRLQQIRILANLLTFITPRPDLIVLLNGDPSVILTRKPELPLDEIYRQQKMMAQLLPKFGKVLRIDVTFTEPLDVARMIHRKLFQNELTATFNHHEDRKKK